MSQPPPAIRDLLAALLHDPDGRTDLRRAAAARAAATAGGEIDPEGAVLPDALAPWVDAVATRAWETSDDDVQRLRAAGFDEDAIYEVTVAAAVGASLARMQAGLRALDALQANPATAAPLAKESR